MENISGTNNKTTIGGETGVKKQNENNTQEKLVETVAKEALINTDTNVKQGLSGKSILTPSENIKLIKLSSDVADQILAKRLYTEEEEGPSSMTPTEIVGTTAETTKRVMEFFISPAGQEVYRELGIPVEELGLLVNEQVIQDIGFITAILGIRAIKESKDQLLKEKENLAKLQAGPKTDSNKALIEATKKTIKNLEKEIEKKQLEIVSNIQKVISGVGNEIFKYIEPLIKEGVSGSVNLSSHALGLLGAPISGAITLNNIVGIFQELAKINQDKDKIKQNLEQLRSELPPTFTEEGEKIEHSIITALDLKLYHLEKGASVEQYARLAKEILSLMSTAHGVASTVLIMVGLKMIASSILGPVGVPLVASLIGMSAGLFYILNKPDVETFFKQVPDQLNLMLVDRKVNKYIGEELQDLEKAANTMKKLAQEKKELIDRQKNIGQAKENISDILSKRQKSKETSKTVMLQIIKGINEFFTSDVSEKGIEQLIDHYTKEENEIKQKLEEIEQKLSDALEELRLADIVFQRAQVLFEGNLETEELRNKKKELEGKIKIRAEKGKREKEAYRWGAEVSEMEEFRNILNEIANAPQSEEYAIYRNYFSTLAPDQLITIENTEESLRKRFDELTVEQRTNLMYNYFANL